MGHDTNTAHFSIMMGPAPHLNGDYTIFGERWAAGVLWAADLGRQLAATDVACIQNNCYP
jgi:cyclophilin family peptidyl-prolyl cis-trans isomerase